MQKNKLRVLDSNITKAAKILGVTRGALLHSLAGAVVAQVQKKTFRPIQWDGTAKGASKVLRHMPSRTVSTCGGAPGYPTELFLQSKTGRDIGKAKKGDWIGIDWNGHACVVPAPHAASGEQ